MRLQSGNVYDRSVRNFEGWVLTLTIEQGTRTQVCFGHRVAAKEQNNSNFRAGLGLPLCFVFFCNMPDYVGIYPFAVIR